MKHSRSYPLGGEARLPMVVRMTVSLLFFSCAAFRMVHFLFFIGQRTAIKQALTGLESGVKLSLPNQRLAISSYRQRVSLLL
jgi:hypothetical protein